MCYYKVEKTHKSPKKLSKDIYPLDSSSKQYFIKNNRNKRINAMEKIFYTSVCILYV